MIPTSRVNYLTPNILQNIYEKESKMFIEKQEKTKFKNYSDITLYIKKNYQLECSNLFSYETIETCPNELLAKHSASQFHSGWFTWGLGLNRGAKIS